MSAIDSLNKKKDQANAIIDYINSKSSEISIKYAEADKILRGISVDSEAAKKLKAKLNDIIESSNESIKAFNSEKNRVNRIYNEINMFYTEKYQPTFQKIIDRKTGLNQSVEKCKLASNKTLQYKDLCEKNYKSIEKLASELKEKGRELLQIDRTIRKLVNDVNSNKLKSTESTNEIKNLEKRISKIHSDLLKVYNNGENLENKLITLLSDSEKEYENIITLKSSSEDLYQEIKNLYEIAADTGLGGEFDKRRNHLKQEMSKWERKIYKYTLILLSIIFAIFIGQLALYGFDIKNQTFDINFYVRFLLASPIVFYIYFCNVQHNHISKLHDKYGFKTTLSATIRSHLLLLSNHDRFSNQDDIRKILDFILDGFRVIYSEPTNDDDYKVKLKLASMEMDIEKRLIKSLSRTVQDIPEPCKIMFSKQQTN